MTKSKLLLSFVTAFLTSTLFAQSQFKVIKLNSSKLPKDIKYAGKLKNAIRWTDKLGDNIVIETETGIYQNPKFKHENDGADAEIFAYHYMIKESSEQTWKIYDFIQDCPVDIEANFIENILQITDLNKDSIAEVWIMYKTVCHGDVSPSDMKIIMYQGQQKFAMRGQNKVQLSEKEFYGGDYKFDKAFTYGPKEFREFALKLWNKNIMQTWGQ